MEYERFFGAVDELVAINREMRKERAATGWDVDIEVWVQEFCVVSCDVGRGSGKSEYIRRRAKEGDLVVTFGEREFRDVPFQVLTGVQVYRVDGQRFNTIFVDEPGLVFREITRETLFGLLTHDREQTFIMLGAN